MSWQLHIIIAQDIIVPIIFCYAKTKVELIIYLVMYFSDIAFKDPNSA